MNERRFAEIKVEGKWVQKPFNAIMKGDIFRLFEGRGIVVKDEDGTDMAPMEALENARVRDDGVGEIIAERME